MALIIFTVKELIHSVLYAILECDSGSTPKLLNFICSATKPSTRIFSGFFVFSADYFPLNFILDFIALRFTEDTVFTKEYITNWFKDLLIKPFLCIHPRHPNLGFNNIYETAFLNDVAVLIRYFRSVFAKDDLIHELVSNLHCIDHQSSRILYGIENITTNTTTIIPAHDVFDCTLNTLTIGRAGYIIDYCSLTLSLRIIYQFVISFITITSICIISGIAKDLK